MQPGGRQAKHYCKACKHSVSAVRSMTLYRIFELQCQLKQLQARSAQVQVRGWGGAKWHLRLHCPNAGAQAGGHDCEKALYTN